MAPRLTLRRGYVLLLAVTCLLFLAVNLHQRQELFPGRPARRHLHHRDPAPPSADQAPDAGWQRATPAPGDLLEDPEEQEPEEQQSAGRPWYLSGGSRWPTASSPGRRRLKLWPAEDPGSDRITQQLMFVPARAEQPEPRLKKILLYNGLGSWSQMEAGRGVFLRSKCPVDTCSITASKAEAGDAAAILFKDHFSNPSHARPPHQEVQLLSQPWIQYKADHESKFLDPRMVWILYFLECPHHTQHVKHNDVFNWTATYRRDSDLVAPYERWAYHDDAVRENPLGADRNYAANKTRKVAWFVSNCSARNRRLQYARELQKHISVDVFGACGPKKCPRSSATKCFELLDRDYKFYLAFENSNCKDYITEKFFVNGLGHNVLPIVMGARPEDYARAAPHHSYIHVDMFASPKELADYLHRLDRDDDLYNSYFRWKGTGEFINTYFFCRLCAMLHDDFPAKWYRDVNDWWRGPGTCTAVSWRKSRAPGPTRWTA